jgi:uncharacterized protein (TIGR02246 family)
VLIALIALLWAGCSGHERMGARDAASPKTGTADATAIKALIDDWARLYNAGAYDSLSSMFYAEDAVLMSPDRPPHNGRAAILRSFQTDAKANDEHVDSSVAEDVRVSGDLAVARGTDTGTTTPKSTGKPERYSLSWVMAFERQPDGTWKCIYEIWNDNQPPETAAARQ